MDIGQKRELKKDIGVTVFLRNSMFWFFKGDGKALTCCYKNN